MTDKCNHEGSLHFDINVEHVIDADVMQIQFSVRCKACGMQFEFHGIPHGASFYHPTVSLDNKVICIPMVEQGKTVRQGLPGFETNMIPKTDKLH